MQAGLASTSAIPQHRCVTASKTSSHHNLISPLENTALCGQSSRHGCIITGIVRWSWWSRQRLIATDCQQGSSVELLVLQLLCLSTVSGRPGGPMTSAAPWQERRKRMVRMGCIISSSTLLLSLFNFQSTAFYLRSRLPESEGVSTSRHNVCYYVLLTGDTDVYS